MRKVFDRLSRDEETDRSVLIQGERGSGRRFVAREIHSRSARHGRPFVVHDCRRQEPLEFRRILFGQIRELAPGHSIKYLGLLEEARDGTLYLEGIDRLPAELQQTLARVIEARQFSPLGSDRDMEFRGRFIASCDEDLSAQVEAGSFINDLYQVLARQGICVKLERKEEGREGNRD